MANDNEVPIFMRHPNPDMTPAQFEEFVAKLIAAAEPRVENFKVTLHEKVIGSDGTWDFDATIRFRMLGLDHLVILEAKQHKYPIKREVVELLHSRIRSVGAHKGVVVSTAPFQSGALDYALAHGIALVRVTEGRFTFERRSAQALPHLTRQEAAEYGIDTYIAITYRSAGNDGSITIANFSADESDALLPVFAPWSS